MILGSGPVSFTLPVGLTWVESGHPAFSSFSEVAYLSQGPRQEGPPFWSSRSETGWECLGPGREGRGWCPPGRGVSLSQLTWHRVLRRSAARSPHPHASSGFHRPQASSDRARLCFCLNCHNHTFSHRPWRAVGCPEVGPRVQESPISTGTLETPILGKGPLPFSTPPVASVSPAAAPAAVARPYQERPSWCERLISSLPCELAMLQPLGQT